MASRLFRWIASSAIVLLISVPESGAQIEQLRLGEIATTVLRDFEGVGASNPGDWLRELRPTSIRPSMRAAVLAQLPSEGEVEITPEIRKKLLALNPVFDLHDRRTVYEVKVIRIRQAKVALLERCVVLVSEHALGLLTPEELAAHAAHEVGHEYFWCDYAAAARFGNPRQLQALELRCDAIAVLTLVSLGLDPTALTRGVAKLNRFNERIGATANAGCYPSLKERERLAQALTEACRRSIQFEAKRQP